MFKNLFDLSYKRSGREVFGFYLFYSIVGAFAAGLICGFFIMPFYPNAQTFEAGIKIGTLWGPVVAVLYSTVLSLSIISSKKIFNSFKAVLLAIISIPLIFYFGAFFGLIPVTVLTTFDSQADY